MIRIYREKESHKKVPLFHGMSFIEKFIMIMGPILIAYLIYMISDSLEYIWWIRVAMSIGITTILWILIYFFADFMSRKDLY